MYMARISELVAKKVLAGMSVPQAIDAAIKKVGCTPADARFARKIILTMYRNAITERVETL